MTPTVTTAPTASWPVGVFGRGRSHPARAIRPAIRPMTAATMANAAAGPFWNGGGRTNVHSRFDSAPVSAPAIGPARAATRIVPMLSR